MAIPDFQSIMRPLLEAHADGAEHINRELVATLAEKFGLSDNERREMLPSGGARLFDNRVGWAKTHILNAGLIASPHRAVSIITDRGREALAQNEPIDLRFLGGIEAYQKWRNSKSKNAVPKRKSDNPTPAVDAELVEPLEAFDNAYQYLRGQIEADLLEKIMLNPPDFLEQVIVDLVVKMGYGGSRKDAGEALGKSGDEGIDGIIKEDLLGLDVIYLQAKRWKDVVGRPEVQKFAGALQGKRASKGIFITTSSFTAGAEQYVKQIGSKIILIDGERLARFMFDHGIGVTTKSTCDVKEIDSDYF